MWIWWPSASTKHETHAPESTLSSTTLSGRRMGATLPVVGQSTVSDVQNLALGCRVGNSKYLRVYGGQYSMGNGHGWPARVKPLSAHVQGPGQPEDGVHIRILQ